jgi:hypothetical protein
VTIRPNLYFKVRFAVGPIFINILIFCDLDSRMPTVIDRQKPEPADPCYARSFLRVRAALRAACDRLDAVRLRAEDFACDDNARCDTPLRPSFFKAPTVARERFLDGARLRDALPFVCFSAEAVPDGAEGTLTPAFLAFESPMAIACFGLRTPCFPSRT